ncbi:hypothetical protein ACFQDM_07220 [Ponticaulis profundi]|uniref:Uncharacterized protein n=2 Tax=Ponticaulis profundi TaxID=2665222 RepID=A0ABW1S849_9PROT
MDMTPAQQIVEEAFNSFDDWKNSELCPDPDEDIFLLVDIYSEDCRQGNWPLKEESTQ